MHQVIDNDRYILAMLVYVILYNDCNISNTLYFLNNLLGNGGDNMKNVFWITTILLLWLGAANAGVLKVKVPVDEFDQMKSRIEALKNENDKLKAEINSYAVPAEEVDSVKAKEMRDQIEALERENDQLKSEVKTLAEKPSGADPEIAKEMNSRIDSLGRENRKLKLSVASLKEKGQELQSDKRTANHIYFETNKKFSKHIFE